MGLIARQIEAAGVPTLCMGSALSILGAVFPPRIAFLDFPLGHTTGRAGELAEQVQILRDAFAAFEAASPGRVTRLDNVWEEGDAWKDRVMRPDPEDPHAADNRTVRFDTPQYQNEEDRIAAETGGECETCVYPSA